MVRLGLPTPIREGGNGAAITTSIGVAAAMPNDYKPTSLVMYHDWWKSSDSRLNSFQACNLPDGPLFESVAVTSCANSPAAKKDFGISEVEVPEANTQFCCSSSASAQAHLLPCAHAPL
ncbi:hypothetical protein H6P81_021481 [Aristolochia fimbriata]|uniref:Uncharacterized protein n=1 Tax=Aristolochia fimbriata TaxID=158543 RepID=A0AAV7DPS6_ARIFI|nr:hypothetical protein H6P81_021481 [Aristolochia fimbriata]